MYLKLQENLSKVTFQYSFVTQSFCLLSNSHTPKFSFFFSTFEWWLMGCHILQLPEEEGLGGRGFMAAVRVVPSAPTSDNRELLYQSARTRCVNPDKDNRGGHIYVHWDEIFVFEVQPGVSVYIVQDLECFHLSLQSSIHIQTDLFAVHNVITHSSFVHLKC